MTNNTHDSQFELPDVNSSPIFFEDKILYIRASEWQRLCGEQSTRMLVSVLNDAKRVLAQGGSVRLIGLDGGIEVSADRPSELQRILDNANRRRASIGLAPAIPID